MVVVVWVGLLGDLVEGTVGVDVMTAYWCIC
jgi:hypothetical protein